MGDAPDGAPARYATAPTVTGRFPAKLASIGPRHASLGGLLLGAREDGERNSMQVDRDLFDDGASVSLNRCATSRLLAVVNGAGLPAADRTAGHVIYVNAWFDWNRDGDWADATDGCAPEWAVQNLPITADRLGRLGLAVVPIDFKSGKRIDDLWMRVTLTIDEPAVDPTGRGGTAPYSRGETEDHPVQTAGRGRVVFRFRRRNPPPPPPRRKGTFKVACLPNPALVLHGASRKIALKVTDTGSGEIQGSFASPRSTKGYDVKPNPRKPQPRGYPRGGRHVVDDFTFRSKAKDPPTRVEVVNVKFVFRRGNQTQKLTCVVLVIHLEPINVRPFGFPPIGCLGPCAGGPQPFPQLDGNLRSTWSKRTETPPGGTIPIEMVRLQLQAVEPIPGPVDELHIPLDDRPPPWEARLIRFGGPGTATGTLDAPLGGPPELKVNISPPFPGGQTFSSFFDVYYEIPVPSIEPIRGVLGMDGNLLGSFSSVFEQPGDPGPGPPNTRRLEIGVSGNGTVNANPPNQACQPNCTHDYAPGTNVQLQAQPGTGQQLAGWGGDCASAGTNPVCNLTMDADRTASAQFVPISRTLSVTVDGNGQVTGQGIDCGQGTTNDCTQTYPHGQSVQLTATGNVETGWGGDCASSNPSTTCNLTMNGDKTVSFDFGT